MTLRATKGDENLARAHLSRCYMDAAAGGQVVILGEVFDRAPHSFSNLLAAAQGHRGINAA
jgi:hypothetical protein